MRIALNSYDRLVLREGGWGRVAGAVCVGAGALLAAVLAEPVWAQVAACLIGAGFVGLLIWAVPWRTVVFDRASGQITRCGPLPRLSRRAAPVARIHDARVAADWEAAGRLTLHVDGTALPLERGAGTQDRRAVEALVNSWIHRATAD